MGLLDDVAEFVGLGGGSDVTYEVTYDVKSTVDGSLASIIEGGERPVEVDVGLDDVNIGVAGELTSTIQGGEAPIALDVGGGERAIHAVGELTASTQSNLAVTEPIVSEISSRVDVEPIVVDLCVDVGLSKLPRASIRQPYRSHFGMNLLGTELFGFDWSGQSDTVIDELPDRGPKIIDGSHSPRPANGPTKPRHETIAEDRGRSLRIRLD